MRLIAAVCVLLTFTLSVTAQNIPRDFVELEKTIEAEVREKKVPGASFAVISGDQIIWARGFGSTSAEEGGVPVTPDTLFRMGSTTKMFTTAATLAALADAGKIRLEDPVRNYVKNLTPKVSTLTAHQLLSQSSGLRDLPPFASGNDDAVLRQNIRLWKDDIFFTEPNEIYSYSSANYWLAGLLAEEVHGKPYADTLRELILKPLGMSRSTVRAFEAMTYPLALGHDVKDNSAIVVRPIDNNAAKYPGGSLYSSANELARWAIAMMNGGRVDGKQSLSPTIVGNLQKPQFYLPGAEKVFYGYGLLGSEEGGVKTLSHGGAARGYGSTIFFAPEQKIAVIVLANASGETLPKSRRKAMELLLPLKPETKEESKTLVVSADEAKRYVGRYEHAPQTWEVFIKDNKLFIKEDGKDFDLKKAGDNQFDYEQGRAIFVPDERGEIHHLFMGLYAARKIS